MTIHIHKLEGCAPAPLAHYLKALAVLRLVAEQRDPEIRGWWKDEAFWIATALSRDELLRFFLEEYQPTPILSPWNGGSGFFYEEDPGLAPLENSVAPRLARFRAGITAARAISVPLSESIARLKVAEELAKLDRRNVEAAEAARRAKVEKDELKGQLLWACRRSWTGGLLEWFDAALALDGKGEASWPALLGSGGNDGRLDFTNNSMQHLASLFQVGETSAPPTTTAPSMLCAALFGDRASGLLGRAAGQFLPGSAGGDNMGTGFSGASLVNPWDFVLMLEGTVMLASSVVRTADTAGLPQAAAPFALRSSGVGYGSAASADEGPRGEQWLPLWPHPALRAEVTALFSEGRIRIGRRTSTRPLDAARALSRLGAARGVTEFARFGFIERNGQANLAVPLGRWHVSSQPNEELLEDVDLWLARFRAFARDDHAPKSVQSAARVVDEAVMAACRTGRSYAAWQSLLMALTNAELSILASPRSSGDPKKNLRPLPLLRAKWLHAAHDGSPEFRLAMALAGQDVALRTHTGEGFLNVRAHWMPLERSHASRRAMADRRAATFATDLHGLANDPDVVCTGANLERDCIALVRRRVQLAPTLSTRGLGLIPGRRDGAPLVDVMAFLARQVDDARVLSLARALMAIAWWDPERPEGAPPRSNEVDAVYAVTRICHLSTPLDVGSELTVKLDPEPSARLARGDLAGAVDVCLRRLRATGLSPTLRAAVGDAPYARRLLASLAFPIRRADVSRCAHLVTKPHEIEESHAD